MPRHPFRVALLLAILVTAPLAGCGKDDNPADPEPDPPGPPPGYSTAAEAVQAWAQALSAKDPVAVDKLLEPDPAGRTAAGFRFYPPSQDIGDFPWMTEESWSRAEELAMLGHMMDSTFVSQETGNSIDSIEAELEITSATETDEGTLVAAAAAFQVLWAANSGVFVDVRLEILLVKNAEGYFVMRSMRELPLFAGGREEASPEPASWALVKAQYR